MASLRSSPFSETEAKPYPHQQFQDNGAHGPKGAYEARKVEGGLYVRVDMPGVPPDNVKVFKNREQRTVTFTGKSPPKTATENEMWAFLGDLSYRVYGGYVALDRDPADVEVKYEVKAGCLRLFFPDCDGSLHFLSSATADHGGTGTPSAQSSGQEGETEEVQVDEPPLFSIEHDIGLTWKGGKEENINLYLLSGPKGVYDHKVLKQVNGDGLQIYLRLDVPGASDIAYRIMEKDKSSIASAHGPKDSPFDEGSREYKCLLSSKCSCCRYNLVQQELRNGVLRYLVRWAPNR